MPKPKPKPKPKAPPRRAARNYLAQAEAYRRAVIAGVEPACRYIVQACERQERDLARQADPTWPYRFDRDAAERPCRFMERLPHIKGPLARLRQPFRMEPWQAFLITTAYGWLHKDAPPKGWAAQASGKWLGGKRRFRTVYLEVPRGNGKSFLLSALTLYALGADGEAGPEVYSAATTRDQAKIVFDSARKMAMNTPDLRAALGITIAKAALVVEDTAGTFKPLSSDEDSLEGLNIHFVAIDELHAHKRRAVYDVCESAMGKRDQPMMWIITTAGSDTSGICYESRSYLVKILQQTAIDESWFGMIYTIDRDESKDADDSKGDDWRSEAVWRKANPNWDVSVEPNHIARMAQKAMQLPSSQSNFKTKHLNVWVNADSAWLDMRHWHGCANPDLRIEAFQGRQALVSLDLASKIDIAVRLKLFWEMLPTTLADGKVEQREHYYLFADYYLPATTIAESTNDSYQGWREMGLLTETAGDVIDYSIIETDIRDDAKLYRPIEVVYDPWQAFDMAQRLQNDAIPVVEYRPTVANFSAPMKEIQALTMERRLHHDGDPVMAWMMSNVVCHKDAKDNIFPRKERDANKIDGPVALIMAIGRRLQTMAVPKPQIFFA